QVLNLAAKETESGVDDALRVLFEKEAEISFHSVSLLLEAHRLSQSVPAATEVSVSAVNLDSYDVLLQQSTYTNNSNSLDSGSYPQPDLVPLNQWRGAL
ncbi:MAG: hypothetical protein GY755_23605, partial [Chloroflexi bacterium]|nr:hypothetical protein [Chloroflexota bacterium]